MSAITNLAAFKNAWYPSRHSDECVWHLLGTLTIYLTILKAPHSAPLIGLSLVCDALFTVNICYISWVTVLLYWNSKCIWFVLYYILCLSKTRTSPIGNTKSFAFFFAALRFSFSHFLVNLLNMLGIACDWVRILRRICFVAFYHPLWLIKAYPHSTFSCHIVCVCVC